jgi:hypothetical protein
MDRSGKISGTVMPCLLLSLSPLTVPVNSITLLGSLTSLLEQLSFFHD